MARNDQFIDADDLGILDSPEAVLSTMDQDGDRRWLYPTPSKGFYYWWRLAIGWALIAFFVSLPWIQINGKPAVLLDLMEREFTLFGTTFYPTDTLLLLGFLLGTLVSIILISAVFGRIWCGWGCPQTVYLEFVYRPIERWIEGAEHVRKRRDEGPLTFDKAWRKTAKWGVYAVLSLVLAHTFVSYFVGWDRLLTWMQSDPRENWGYFLMMAGTTGLILYDFGFFREQMCTIACPYARFQSVLLDPDSLIVSYDEDRGEPRGRGKDRSELGDCIDCGACVRTCPTGIDIRDGLQMECVACTQCIDACDDIMDKMGWEPGLIKYTSEKALNDEPTKIARPRTLLYSGVLLALTVFFVGLLWTRSSYDINVARAGGQPFMELPDDRIANRIRVRVRNQTATEARFSIGAEGIPNVQVNPVGTGETILAPQEMKRTEAWIIVPPDALSNEREVTILVQFDDGTEERIAFPLLSPSSREAEDALNEDADDGAASP